MTIPSVATTESARLFKQLRKEFATGNPTERHAWAVHAIHLDQSDDPAVGRFALEQCHAFVAAAVPCTHPDTEMYASAMLVGHTWPLALEAEIADLMRLYIRHGYFRMNNQVDAFGAKNGSSRFGPGQTCLERAIRSGNISAAVVLVEEGERVDLVPMMKLGGEPPFTDMIAMAAAWWENVEFPAKLSEAAMRRHITVNTQPVDASMQPQLAQPRHRRHRL